MKNSSVPRFLIAAGLCVAAAACATTESSEAPIAAAKPSKPVKPVYVLSDIEYATASELTDTLGEASLTRREGIGEYRRYGLKTCALIIILYPDDTGGMRATHFDAVALRSGEEKPDLDSCLAAG